MQPRRVRPVPPSAAQLAEIEAQRARFEAQRQADQHHRDAQRPRREQLLDLGPALTDREAALDCVCSCHGQLPQPSLHDAGANCSCQLSAEQRQRSWDELRSVLAEHRPVRDRAGQRVSLERRLGVALSSYGGLAPFQAEGVVDGLAFYARERHGKYTIDVAAVADGTPVDHRDYIEIASGDEAELYGRRGDSEEHAVIFTVGVVRDYLRRVACTHDTPRHAEHRYCSRCGIALADLSRWADLGAPTPR